MTYVKSWAVGLPVVVSLTRLPDDTYTIELDVDTSEIAVAVAEDARTWEDSDDLSDREFDALDTFSSEHYGKVRYVASGVAAD